MLRTREVLHCHADSPSGWFKHLDRPNRDQYPERRNKMDGGFGKAVTRCDSNYIIMQAGFTIEKKKKGDVERSRKPNHSLLAYRSHCDVRFSFSSFPYNVEKRVKRAQLNYANGADVGESL
ncbi:hypothetical protein DICVIV_11689 [Dictyocaulus viviparus]|uniref:Uncharacterized protein n=1 Tax=Dictyocaulus viviparus TaxID=29172 RepID=A0A0D8XCK8_DICVI|nr:hypothetical protein DICVIV_11689 [Dictyocaulus viviparus]